MSPRWFAIDTNGRLGVFDSEHIMPKAVDDTDAADLTRALSRSLRHDRRPIRGEHANVRSGALVLIASSEGIGDHAESFEAVTDDVLAALFAPPRPGRPATFMPEVRTFGGRESREATSLELFHELGACAGCVIDRADEDTDVARLHDLGLYIYAFDDATTRLVRGLVPATPLLVSSIGELASRCLRCTAAFASAESLALRDFDRT